MMIKNRCFAFGCSFTSYAYATWSDFLGANFLEYYNYGRAGSSNTFIMNRLIECDHILNFNSETDYVVVMITGFGRFSNLQPFGWNTQGDLHSYYHNTKDKQVEWILTNLWNDRWAIYQSWIAVKTIKNLLTYKNIHHKILMGIDNSDFLKETTDIDKSSIQLVQDIFNTMDNTESYEKWIGKNYVDSDFTTWMSTNEDNTPRLDKHPTQKIHYEYFKKMFPDYDTDKSLTMLKFVEDIFITDSQKDQGENYNNKFYNTFNKANTCRLFGQ